MRVAAAIGWSSFLAACLGTMLTFAALDPQVIIDGVEGGEPGAAPWWLTPHRHLQHWLLPVLGCRRGGRDADRTTCTQAPRAKVDGS